ncbi:hypothetical protein [Actinoplanes sp. NPDC049681]|uniref:hypothetical protein n=1 Tax=Actinoplanes sp. NPDC049681 TaxID=3363905 RepID=UPI0037A3B086
MRPAVPPHSAGTVEHPSAPGSAAAAQERREPAPAGTSEATTATAATTVDPGSSRTTTATPAATRADAGDPPTTTISAEAVPAGAAPDGTDAKPDEADAKPAGADAEAGAAAAPTTGRFRRRKAALPSTRPPGAPPDPWTAFAQTTDRQPGRTRRILRATGRGLIHEYALVIYGSLLLAVALTWPALRYPVHTVPQDIWDPARQAWQVSWAGHVLITEPARLWQANAFYPERYSFAFGNSLLGYAPAGMIGGGPLAAVLRYNVLFVLAHALLAVGGYALVRQLGAGRTGAIVGAVAFAYAPWRLAQEGHLDIISAGGIPLALAMLARGHGWSLRYGFRPGRRHAGWAAGGWVVATWQLSLGFSLGLPFAYVLAALIVVVGCAVLLRRLRRRSVVLGWRLLVTDLLGVLIVAGVGALVAVPYLRVGDTGPAGTEIAFFSPPVRSLLIGPAESRIWGAPHAVARQSLTWPAEMTLLPGFVLYALALVGLVFSVWRMWHRLILLVAVLVSAVFTLGTTVLDGRWTYLPLFGHLPASFGVRIPGRLMLWVTLFLAILAAGAVAEFVRRAEHLAASRTPPQPGPGPWLRLATFVPLLLILGETWNATAHPVVPAQPAAMRTVTGPMLVLPTAALSDQTVMLWSTSRFQELANGGGGFAPHRQSELRRAVTAFPDATSVQYLRTLGVGTVLLLRSEAVGTPWERAGDLPVDALGITREDLDNDSVLFRLS